MENSVKPNLFLVGNPKCGTSALFDFLTQHPDVYKSDNKEPNYFCKEIAHQRHKSEKLRKIFAPSYEDYQKLYKNGKDEKYFIDATTHYFYFDKTPKRIYEYNPKAKIVAIIRNPVDFLQSWHSELVWGFEEPEKDFEKALSLEGTRDRENDYCFLFYSDWVQYASFIKRYLNYFDKNQIKIIIFEHFKKDNEKIYKELLNFLDLPPFDGVRFETHNVNKEVRLAWLKRIGQTPIVWSCAKNLPKPLFKFGKDLYHKIIIRDVPKEDIGDELKLSIMKKYKDVVVETNSLLHEHGFVDNNFNLVKFWGYDKI